MLESAEDEVRQRLGWTRLNRLERIVVACVIVGLVGVGVLGWYLVDISGKVQAITKNTNSVVHDRDANDAKLKSQFAAQEAALRALKRSTDQLSARISDLEQREVRVIIEDRSAPGSTRVVVVQPTPSPQPTATVTCDPTPIIGNCRRGQR